MNRRNGIVYVSIRRWRRSVKRYQIDALKMLKADPPSGFVDAVVTDILTALDPMLGSGAFRCIVPVPGSHSPTERCLSILMASRLGFRLGLPARPALSIEGATGSSHPRQNISRARMQLDQTVEGPAIVIDDVASTGSHIEEAVTLIKPDAGAVFAIVWISGEQDSE